MRDERVEIRKRTLGRRDPHQFDFLELVLADQAAGVFAGRAGFFAKARRIRGVLARQRLASEDLVAVVGGERHLGGRDQEQVDARIAEHRIGEFGELPGREHRRAQHEIRHPEFEVAVARGPVQEKGGDRAREARTGAAQHGEAATGELRRALEIDDAQRLAQFPVWLGGEVEPAGCAPIARDDVLFAARANGHARVEHVRHVGENRRDPLLEQRQLRARRGDPRIEVRDRRPQFGRRGRPVGGALDALGERIFLGLERLDGGDARAPGRIEFEDRIDECGVLAAPARGAARPVGIAADQSDIQHR